MNGPSATTSRVEMLRGLWAHERDAMDVTLTYLQRAWDGAPDHSGIERATNKLVHTVRARQVWLDRLQGRDEPREIFPTGCTPARAHEEWDEQSRLWGAYFSALVETALDRECRYRSGEGVAYVTRVGDILLHVCTHGFYHRGQIATLVADAGGSPHDTDFILAVRRRDEEPPA